MRTDAAATWRRTANGQEKCTSGLLSGPLTGTLLHSLKFNTGSLEKREKVRHLAIARRCVSAKASLPVTAPSRSALPWPDRALAHAVPGGLLRKWSPTRACRAASSGLFLLALSVSMIVCFVFVLVRRCPLVLRNEVSERKYENSSHALT